MPSSQIYPHNSKHLPTDSICPSSPRSPFSNDVDDVSVKLPLSQSNIQSFSYNPTTTNLITPINNPSSSSYSSYQNLTSQNSKDVLQMFETFHQTSHGTFKASFYNPFEVKHRKRTTREQQIVLENFYRFEEKPDCDSRRSLAIKIGMAPRAVQVWFQNRRAKHKSILSTTSNFPSKRSNSICNLQSPPMTTSAMDVQSRQRSQSATCSSLAELMVNPDSLSSSSIQSSGASSISPGDSLRLIDRQRRERSLTAPLMSLKDESIAATKETLAQAAGGNYLRPIAPNPSHLLKTDLQKAFLQPQLKLRGEPNQQPPQLRRRHSVASLDSFNNNNNNRHHHHHSFNRGNSNVHNTQSMINFIPITSSITTGSHQNSQQICSSPGSNSTAMIGTPTLESCYPTTMTPNDILPFKELKDAIFGKEDVSPLFKDHHNYHSTSYPSMSNLASSSSSSSILHYNQFNQLNQQMVGQQTPSSPSKRFFRQKGCSGEDDPNTNYIRYIQLQQQLQQLQQQQNNNNHHLCHNRNTLPPPSPNMSYNEYLSHIQAYNSSNSVDNNTRPPTMTMMTNSANINFYNPFITSGEGQDDPMVSGNNFSYFSSPTVGGGTNGSCGGLTTTATMTTPTVTTTSSSFANSSNPNHPGNADFFCTNI